MKIQMAPYCKERIKTKLKNKFLEEKVKQYYYQKI